MSRIFLSHSSRDSREAIALRLWLIEQDPGLADEIFLDLDGDTGLRPGIRWKDGLRRANDRCEAVICLLSADWEASPECMTEYRTAEDQNKPIFCARLEPISSREITREWQRCDLFGDGPQTEIAMDGDGGPVTFLADGLRRLREGLRATGIGAEHFPWPPPHDPDRAPYRGWEPLEAVDAAVFFGRDAQILAGLDSLRGMRSSGVESLFVILGPSGAGKSSFLRAGLLPRLARDDRHFLPMGIVRPERDALTGPRGLAHAIHSMRSRLGLTRPTLGEIKAACPADVVSLRGWLIEAQQAARERILDLPSGAPPPTLILPVDQAEELFSAAAGAQAQQFLALTARLTGDDDGARLSLIIAFTIRSDRYETLCTEPDLVQLKSFVFGELKPMPPTQFKEVVCGPADRASAAGRQLEISPDLVDRLLGECGRGADTLPLLALTLARLYEDYGEGELTLAEYEAMGGMRRVVQTEVDTLLATDPAERQKQLDLLRSAFIPWLATINPDNDQPMRRAARWSDLPADSHALIDALVTKRLLVKDERDGEVVVEVALESLLRQWDDLAGWLRLEAEDLKNSDELERGAAAWRRSCRNDAWLLEGERLGDAETLAARPGFRDRLNPAREFLLASRRREENRRAAERQRREAELEAARERQEAAEALAAAETQAKEEAQAHAGVLRKRSRVLRGVLAATVVVAVVAAFGFLWAFIAEREAGSRAREAMAQQLVSDAQSMLVGARPGGDVRAFQQLLAARSFAPPAVNDDALLGAVFMARDISKIIDTPTQVTTVAFSPAGRQIAAGGADGTVRLWNSETGDQVGDDWVGHEGGVVSVMFSPDGRRLVSGSTDNTVRQWYVDTGKPVGEPLTGHEGLVSSVAYSTDGSRIVSGSFDKTVRLWDADTGQQIGEPIKGHEDMVTSVAFSQDGRRIVSGSADKTIRLWDADTGQPVREPLLGAELVVNSVAFSPDGRRIVSGADKAVRLWDVETGMPIGEPMTGHREFVYSVRFSPRGDRIVSGSKDGTVRLWDAVAIRALGLPLSGHEGFVMSVGFSHGGDRIVSEEPGRFRTVRFVILRPRYSIRTTRTLPHLGSCTQEPSEVESDCTAIQYSE